LSLLATLNALQPSDHGAAQTTPLSGSCYRDTDCQFYSKDSSGLVTGQVVGSCIPRSDSLSMCKCLPAYFGKNCEFKRCPIALGTTEFMCNGVQGEGEDYYGPVKGLYMGSEWNTYDEVLQVDNHIQSYHSTTGRTVTYNQLYRGPHKVGGICDFTTGKCKCHPTYYGPACDLRTCPMGYGHNVLTKAACSGQGECITERAGQEHVCRCHDNFFGLDCSLRHCPNSTRGVECDDHGACEYSTGFCKCNADYYGPSCEFKKCPRVNGRVCNGQGVCYASTWENSIGLMSEGNFTDYQGKKFSSAPVQCSHTSGHTAGTGGQLPDASDGNTCRPKTGQKAGVCSCRWPYFGPDCSLKLCPNSTYEGSGSGLECDGHGTCDRGSGSCICETGYFGKDCHLRLCPSSDQNQQLKSLECNGEGTCDREWGTCKCHNHRYWGPACEKLRCLSYPGDSNGLVSKHSEHYTGPTQDEDGYLRWPNECGGSDQGECNVHTGMCMCKPGFHGDDCAQRGSGDGIYNRRLELNFNEGRKLRSDGTLRDRVMWHFSGEGVSVPQVMP